MYFYNLNCAVYLTSRILEQELRELQNSAIVIAEMGQACGAHTLLGTVVRLLIPASVHLYTDRTAGGLRVPLFSPMRALAR